MNRKNLFSILILIILAFSFTGCTRSATTPEPKDAADAQSDSDFPVLTEIISTDMPGNEFSTMTAQAVMAKEEAAQATEAPSSEGQTNEAAPAEAEAAEPTATPEPIEAIPTATMEPVPAAQITDDAPSFPIYEGVGPGFPTFGIRGVIRDDTVTIQANDFPADQTYIVYMGPMNTGAVNGIVIEEKDTGSGGSYLETYAIPDALKSSSQISIRVVFSGGRYAVNWFYNNTTQ